MSFRGTVLALLLAQFALAGCGLKGDPIRPGSPEDVERRQEARNPPPPGGG